jgi:hypothetical protein
MPVKTPVDHLPTEEEARAKFHSGKWLQHRIREGETVWVDPKTKVEVTDEWRAAFSEEPELWRDAMTEQEAPAPGMTTNEKLAIAAIVGAVVVGVWWWMK